MNFLSCTLEGNVARFNGAGITLSEELAAKGNKAKGKLELGIRPMYLEVHAEAVEGGVPAKVKAVEDLGSYKIVTAALNGEILRAKLPEGRPVPEEHAWLAFPPQWIKLFSDGRLVK